MIHDIPPPAVSPAFSVEDIHRIREWNYERLKDSTLEERRADTDRRIKSALETLGLPPNVPLGA